MIVKQKRVEDTSSSDSDTDPLNMLNESELRKKIKFGHNIKEDQVLDTDNKGNRRKQRKRMVVKQKRVEDTSSSDSDTNSYNDPDYDPKSEEPEESGESCDEVYVNKPTERQKVKNPNTCKSQKLTEMKTIEAAKGDNEMMMEAKVPHRETNEENTECHENYQEQLDQEATDVKEETLEENEITRDKTFPQIYIRKVMKSSKRKKWRSKKTS